MNLLETGISTIDFMNTQSKGQKLPIFTGSGLPANKLAAQIAKYARTFYIFGQCATFPGCVRRYRHNPREASFFKRVFEQDGSIYRGVFFLQFGQRSGP